MDSEKNLKKKKKERENLCQDLPIVSRFWFFMEDRQLSRIRVSNFFKEDTKLCRKGAESIFKLSGRASIRRWDSNLCNISEKKKLNCLLVSSFKHTKTDIHANKKKIYISETLITTDNFTFSWSTSNKVCFFYFKIIVFVLYTYTLGWVMNNFNFSKI